MEDRFSQPAFVIQADELATLLAGYALLKEIDSGMTGAIRVLEHPQGYILSEQDCRGQIWVRYRKDLAELEALIEERLASYERMWDG